MCVCVRVLVHVYGRGKVNFIHLCVNDSRGAKRVLWD